MPYTSSNTLEALPLRSAFLLLLCFASSVLCGTGPQTNDLLTAKDRVALQKSIETVYWRHRIWPKENKTPKPSIEELIPDSSLVKKVDSYLRKSAALETIWQTMITPDQIQTEMNRMVRESKDHATLSEIFSALKNDPHLIAEGLAHPLLVEQKIRNLYAYDNRFHGSLRKRVEADLDLFGSSKSWTSTSGTYLETTWVRNEESIPPDDPQTFHLSTDEWKKFQGKLQTIFNQTNQEILPSGSHSSIQEDENQFYVIKILEQDENRIRLGTVHWNKIPFDEWWNETQTSITPAEDESAEYDYDLPAFQNVSCSPDSWTPTAEPPEPNVPSARTGHVAEWTGTEMVVWGGLSNAVHVNSGGRYYPATNSWLPTSMLNVPIGRALARSVWTGTEMIVWSGFSSQPLNRTGGRYNAATDTWAATSLTNAPEDRTQHTAVWTGTEMIVWGGWNDQVITINTGAKYNPATDSWLATSLNGAPSIRRLHSAVWAGNKMIIWGGWGGPAGLNTGGIYDPQSDDWQSTSVINTPVNRMHHSAVWSGTEMIIWGGWQGGNYFNSGGKYDPSTDTWSATSIINAPIARRTFTALWTGNEMLIWGGINETAVENSGGRYNPVSDQWLATSLVNAPQGRALQTGIWTGSTMIVWGGINNKATGGIYCVDPNTFPISVDDNFDAVEDTVLTVDPPGVLSNDTDSDSDSLTAILNVAPSNGNVTVNNDGSFEYTPSPNFNGVDSFTYQAFDGFDYSDPSTVSLNIQPVNDPPVADDDFYSGIEDSQIDIPLPGVLTNDNDVENDPLTALLISGPSNGQLNLNSNGAFTYIPQANFNGTDSFIYNANDAELPSNPATVSITIAAVNDAPIAADDTYSATEDSVLTIVASGVLSNDSDVEGNSLTAILDSPPSNGALNLNTDGSFSYMPNPNFNGIDSFSYRANDGDSNSNVATVNIIVGAVNDPPVAMNDNATVVQNSKDNPIDVLSNDIDDDGDTLLITSVTQGANGIVSISDGGSALTYTPDQGFNGSDNFSYTVDDGNGGSSVGMVAITVGLPSCLFCDDFNDGILNANWNYIRPAWSESNGTLNGIPDKKKAVAVATPIFAGCQNCYVETSIKTNGGALNKVWLLTWYQNKRNTVELLMKEENDTWVLKQRSGGAVVSKAKGNKIINPNTTYIVKVLYDGLRFQLFVDDMVIPLFTLTPQALVPVGSVGFQIKNTTASFDYIVVNN